jgi:sugar lactone lactonase YvrE
VIARPATRDFYLLAEGPIWNPASRCLHWVDIEAGRVLTGDLGADGSIDVTREVRLSGSAGTVAFTTDETLLIAMDGSLATVAGDGAVSEWRRVLFSTQPGRLNDGKVDPQGRFVVGSHSRSPHSTTEVLALVDGSRTTVIDHDLTLSNGLAWSNDGRWFYSVDTFRHSIYRRPWNVAGPAGARTLFATIEDGYPDGIAVDADDHLWVAVWGAGRVDRLAPTGERVASIPISVPNVSSVAFAGDDLGTLVITTAREGLSPTEVAQFPDSGRLFTLQPGVTGVPSQPWAGLAERERSR